MVEKILNDIFRGHQFESADNRTVSFENILQAYKNYIRGIAEKDGFAIIEYYKDGSRINHKKKLTVRCDISYLNLGWQSTNTLNVYFHCVDADGLSKNGDEICESAGLILYNKWEDEDSPFYIWHPAYSFYDAGPKMLGYQESFNYAIFLLSEMKYRVSGIDRNAFHVTAEVSAPRMGV